MGSLACLVGPDGVGKTTQARLLVQSLRRHGFKVRYVWLRFSHFLSLPILAIARLVRLSEQVTYEGKYRVGYHNFQKSAFLSTAYEAARTADFYWAYVLRVRLWTSLGWVVVCDRFFPDVLADLRLSTGRQCRFSLSAWQRIRKNLPRKSILFFLNAPEEALRSRRPDLGHDRTLGAKVGIYNELAKLFALKTYDAQTSREELHSVLEPELLRAIQTNHTTYAPGILLRLHELHSNLVKGGTSNYHARIALILLSSWLFQGILYADRTELAFKLLFEAGLLLIAAFGLLLFLPFQLAFFVAWPLSHSLNWLLNGQPFVALKHVNRSKIRHLCLDNYVSTFTARASKTDCFRFCAVYGSTSVGESSDTSDLDIKLVRRRGLKNALAAMWFLMAERFRSNLKRFPLDIYVLDTYAQLRTREARPGVILLDERSERMETREERPDESGTEIIDTRRQL